MEDTGAWVSEYDENETFWLSQKAMGELFDCSTDNISLHIKNIYAEDELSEEATAEFFSVVQKEGSREVTEVSHADALERLCRPESGKPGKSLGWKSTRRICGKSIAIMPIGRTGAV